MYVLSCIFNALCAIVLPFTLTVIFCVKKKEIWRPILFGVLTFIVFQVFVRMSINQVLLPQTTWYKNVAGNQPILYALFLGSTTALFGIGGRFIVMSLVLKRHRSALDGIAFGVGYGGIEAIFIAIINVFVLLLSTTEIAASGMVFADSIERISDIVIQIAFSVMVMKSICEKNYVWILLAFTINTATEFGVAMVSKSVDIWSLEAAILFVALLLGWFVKTEYNKSNKNELI